MSQMHYPYSPLGDKRVFHRPADPSSIQISVDDDDDEIDGISSRGQLERIDMNSSADIIDLPHEYVCLYAPRDEGSW